ncbi:MAG: peptidylprolyl isomerase [Alphaproteobacteria bacterium]
MTGPVPSGSASPGRGEWLALLAACGGLALALWSALGAPMPGTGPRTNNLDAIGPAATVDGRPLSRLDFERAMAAVAGDRRTDLTPADRTRVLEMLIAEELLLTRAVEMDLIRHDADLRKAAITAAMRSASGAALDDPPSDAALKAFYRDTPALLSPRPLVRLRHAMVADRAQAMRLAEAIKASAGSGTVAFPDPDHPGTDLALPDRLLDQEKLGDYLGVSLARMAVGLPEGAIAGPLDGPNGIHFLWVLERVDPDRPAFETVRDTVEAEWLRRRDEKRLADLIARLKARADITIADDLAP